MSAQEAMIGGGQDTAGALRRVPLLRGLDDASLALMARRARRVTAVPGDVLMRAGEAAEAVYVLLHGALEVMRHEGGEDMHLARLGAGSVVGELALLGGEVRSATVRAVRHSELLVVAASDFREVLGIGTGGLVLLRTLTERLRTTEAALVRREALAGLGTIAAGLAHELNNPAAALLASTRQLERRLDSTDADVNSLLRDMKHAARAIVDVIGAVGAQVAQSDAPRTRVDAARTVRDTLAVLRPRLQDMQVGLSAPEEPVWVCGHAGELAQIWSNLIANAAEAAGGRGRLRIRIKASGDVATITFCDNGPGIPPAVLPRIFDPFFTTKAAAGGSGLGLHIARSIAVQRYGGRLDVRSRAGHTVFRVVLPAGGECR